MRAPELIDGAALGLPGRKFLLHGVEGQPGTYLLFEAPVSRQGTDRARALQSLQAVARRVTGYEPEKLKPEKKWEADLGVDRVKRLRMIEALAQERPLSRRERGELDREPSIGGWLGILCSGETSLEAQQEAEAQESRAAASTDGSQGPVTEEKVTEILLRVVQEKTGYSRELLDLDADLEADLGIDTIKQAQILGAIRKHYPLRFQEGLRIKDFPTLRHWIRFTLAQASGQKIAGTPRAVASAPSELVRYSIGLEGLPAPAPFELSQDGIVVLTDDGLGISQELKKLLAKRGTRVEILSPEDLDSADAIRSALRRIGCDEVPVRALAHLYPIGRREDSALEDQRCALAALTLAKALRPGLRVFLGATGMGGGFGFDRGAARLRASDGALAGFVKTLAAEWPEVAARALDLDVAAAGASPAEAAETVLSELCAAPEELHGARVIEVGRSALGRVTPRARPSSIDLTAHASVRIDADTVILITGGAQGIGAEIARDLAARHRCALVLLGRTEPSESEPLRKTLASIGSVGESAGGSAGARVLYIRCDVSVPEDVERACGEARRVFGAIHGVIHAAGVLEDAEIEAKSEESFARVYGAKVEGMRNLIRFAVGEEARFVTAFSSVAGRFGNPRQCDYAAANEAIGKLADQLGRDRPGVRSFAVAWGAWDQVGMAARTGVAEVLKAAGESAIVPTEGASALRAEILYGSGEPEIVLRSARPDSQPGGPIRAESAPTAGEFTLLGRFARYRRGDALVAERVLHAEKDRWLKDHTLLENPVMPGTMGVEMMAQAALALFPGFRFAGLRKLRIESGIQLIGQEELAIRVRAHAGPGSSDDEREVRASIEMGESGEGRICYSSTIVLARRAPETGAVPRAALDAEGDAVDPSFIYERIRLGPCFQILSEYRKSAGGGGWGRVGARSVRDFLPEWPEESGAPRFHAMPIPLEAGFHSVALVRLLESGSVLIPRGIGEYIVHREADADQGLLLKAVPKGPTLFDILICDAEGEIRAEVRDFETLDVTEISTWKGPEARA